MELIQTKAYQKAFCHYLRYGTAIEYTLRTEQKELRETHSYIWRTQGDDRVRPEHAARNGEIFSWDDPDVAPPGSEFGCRCWAEPYYEINDPPIEPVYPLEELILILAGSGLTRRVIREVLRQVLGARTNAQTAERISNGHAYEKHKGEFPEIKTREQFKRHVEDVMNNPTEVKELERGRTGYWDQESGTVVIENPADPDGGTVFRPPNGKEYFDILR